MTFAIRGNSLYTIVEGPNWDDAQAYSQTLGGNLASITSAEENEFVRSSFENADIGYETTGSADVYLIGLYRDNADSPWRWVNEEEVSYLNFGRFEPYNGGLYAAMNTFKIGEKTDNYWGADAGSWSDGYGRNSLEITGSDAYGIAEIPLNLSIKTSSTPTEGAGAFATSINLSAGTEASGNLAEGANVYWEVSGITEDDLESGALTGSGVINNGVLEIEHSLIEDYDSGESFEISVFSDAERTQQIGVTEEFAIVDNTPAPVIRGNSLYTIVDGPTWEESEANAVELSGHLVSINDAEENELIKSILNSYFEGLDSFYDGNQLYFIRNGEEQSSDVWIGLNDSVSEGTYEWSSGEGVTYIETNELFDSGNQDYVAMRWVTEEKWGWDDQTNTDQDPIYSPDSIRYTQKVGIAEIPLNLSITTSSTPTEGAGVFTTSINLSAGTEASGNLAEGAEVFWSVSGITEDDLESGELSGSGFITDGRLTIEHSLVNDDDSGDTFNVSVFSDAEMTQKIGETQSFEVLEGEADPITGTLGLPGKVNLKSQGKTPFVLYGNDELIFDPEVQDSLINPESLGFGLVPGETLFTAATKKNGTIHASYEDVDGDTYLDFVVKVATPTIASSELTAGEQVIFAFASTNGEQDLLFTAPSAVFF